MLFRFVRFSSRERRLFFYAFFALPVLGCALRLFGLRKTQEWMAARRKRAESRGRPIKSDNADVYRMVRMIGAASRYGLVRGSCLSQSLVLWHLLQREGYAAKLLVGGRREGESFEAHAWVEIRGEALNDAKGLRALYAPFQASARLGIQI